MGSEGTEEEEEEEKEEKEEGGRLVNILHNLATLMYMVSISGGLN